MNHNLRIDKNNGKILKKLMEWNSYGIQLRLYIKIIRGIVESFVIRVRLRLYVRSHVIGIQIGYNSI